MNFHCDDKAQVSAEMLIVLAAIIAVAVILITQLGKTAEKTGAAVDSKTDQALAQLDTVGK